MEYIAFAAIASGYAFGIICSYRISAYLIEVLRRKSLLRYQVERFICPAGVAGAAIAVIPGFLLALIVGGTFGGGSGEWVSSALGIDKSGILVGLAAGIFFVFVITVCTGTALGALIGMQLNRFLCKRSTT